MSALEDLGFKLLSLQLARKLTERNHEARDNVVTRRAAGACSLAHAK